MKHSLVCFAMLFFGACNAPMSTTGADASLAKPTPEVRAMSAEPIEGESATGGQASLEWRQLAMKDENGWIDPQGLQRARSHRKANLDFAATDSGGGNTALIHAVYGEHDATARLLLERGADPAEELSALQVQKYCDASSLRL